jgi:hypothetical protein
MSWRRVRRTRPAGRFPVPATGRLRPECGPCAGLEMSACPSNGCRCRRMRRGAIWLREARAVDAAGGRPRALLGDGSRSGAQPPGCLLRVVCNRLVKAFTVCRSRIADYLFKDHKPSANQGKARLRGLYRIIYSKTISPRLWNAKPACVTRTLSETPIGYRLSAIGYRLSFPNNYHFVLHLYHRFGSAPGVRYLIRKR